MKRKTTKNHSERTDTNNRAEASDIEIKPTSMSHSDAEGRKTSSFACTASENDSSSNCSCVNNSAAEPSGHNVSDEKDWQRKTDQISNKPHGFRVLIPINSQESSLYALESAMARKWPDDTEFMLLTVVEDLSGGIPDAKIIHKEVLRIEQNEHRQAMLDWLNRLKDSFTKVFPNTEADIECGKIAEQICDVACNWEADYIMVGSHDFSLVDRMALGSIASKVLMMAPCTVEAVRFNKLKRLTQPASKRDTEDIRQLANQSPRRIIVATDFSQQAAGAIDWVARADWFDNTAIRLVTVTESSKREPGVAFLAGSKGYIAEQQYQRTLEDKLRAIGREIADKQPHCKLEVFVLQSDSVSGAILELASLWDADLVVVGAQGAGSTDEAKVGSSALPIMDSLECSAIAIRNHSRQQVHFSWYPELQKTDIESQPAEKFETKKS